MDKFLPDNILKCMSKDDRRPMGKAGLTNNEIQRSNHSKLEKEIQSEIASLLRRNEIWFSSSRMDRKTTNTRGTPDFLFSINGHAIALEVKAKSGVISEEQCKTRTQMIANGWSHFIVRSYEEALEVINRFTVYRHVSAPPHRE